MSGVRQLPTPGRYPCGLTWDGELLWQSDQERQTICGIDPENGDVVVEHACSSIRADLAFDGSELVQIGGRPKRLFSIDRRSGQQTRRRDLHPLSGRATGAAFGPSGLWVCLRDPMVVQLRDPETLDLRAEYPGRAQTPSGLTTIDGRIVYGDFEAEVLHVMDGDSGSALETIDIGVRPTGLASDGNRVWACDFQGRAIRSVLRLRGDGALVAT